MSISLSGGDIAFIAAFIVLPTFVLASCVWAIVAIRSGALLAQRTALTTREDDAEAMTTDWPHAEQANVEPDPAAVDASFPPAGTTGTAEHTMIMPAESLAAEPDAPDLPLVEPAGPADPLAKGDPANPHEPIQETGEFPLALQDWSRPSNAAEPAIHDLAADPPTPNVAVEQSQPAYPAVEPPTDNLADNVDGDVDGDVEVETLAAAPEASPATETEVELAAGDTVEGDDEEPAYDEQFQHTTDLPASAATKRKPARRAVAQLRPPVATTGRSRLRPAGARRPGDALEPDGSELTTEDEGVMEGDDRPVHIRPIDDK